MPTCRVRTSLLSGPNGKIIRKGSRTQGRLHTHGHRIPAGPVERNKVPAERDKETYP